ncbi:MAG TPA: tetratricopeptide repeat protein [Acidimicrobiales bacterium]|nr:tetratricopeptide repeat protein [Acidimicrobiales bacterium]
MSIDVTDATFQSEVIDRSMQVPVVIDLWAEWCGPCRTLGPILETVIGETAGQVVLVKVDVDANPQISQAFQVQSIPAVFAMHHGKIVSTFVGAQPEPAVRQFVAALLPTEEETELGRLVAAGDEASLRQALELEPGHVGAVVALATLLVDRGDQAAIDEALGLLERIPESADTRRVAALARLAATGGADDVSAELDGLLDQVKDDEAARQRYLDLLELMGPEDPRTAGYRKQLTSRLF